MNIGNNNKIKDSNFAEGNITIKKEKENKTIRKIIISIIISVVSTIIATIIIKILNLN